MPESGATTIKIDLTSLPPPSLRVFANGYGLVDHGLIVEVAFLQTRPKGSVRPVLSIVLSAEAASRQLWKTSTQFYESEVRKLQDAEIAPQMPSDSPPEWGQTQVLQANVFRLTRSGTEAIMDCYWLSPSLVHAAAGRTTSPKVDPVATIQMPSPVLVGLLDRISRLSEEMRKRVGPLMPFVE